METESTVLGRAIWFLIQLSLALSLCIFVCICLSMHLTNSLFFSSDKKKIDIIYAMCVSVTAAQGAPKK